MISDINMDVSSSRLISFADDTRLYSNINNPLDCDNLQIDLDHVYNWAVSNNMFFNSKKFNYISFSHLQSTNHDNVYITPDCNIINHTDHVLDLGVYVHVQQLLI